jgi:hypothetical protein
VSRLALAEAGMGLQEDVVRHMTSSGAERSASKGFVLRPFEPAAEADGLKPGSRWAVVFGLLAFSVGTTLWFMVPSYAPLIHGCVFVPIAAGGALSCGLGILVSWRRASWPLRVLGILMVVAAVSPLVLITGAVLSGFMNWPTPER